MAFPTLPTIIKQEAGWPHISMQEIDNFNFPIVCKHYIYELWVKFAGLQAHAASRVSCVTAHNLGESFA